jgi:predicted nucleic acid-binding protein
MSKAKILVDSCYWIALFSPEEIGNHEKAVKLTNDLENNIIVIPWPTLYEFVNTTLAKRKESLFAFEKILLRPNIEKVSDEKYKAIALEKVFESNIIRINSISLIDETLRQMILDSTLKIDYLATFNRKDFEYSCQLRKVLILD